MTVPEIPLLVFFSDSDETSLSDGCDDFVPFAIVFVRYNVLFLFILAGRGEHESPVSFDFMLHRKLPSHHISRAIIKAMHDRSHRKQVIAIPLPFTKSNASTQDLSNAIPSLPKFPPTRACYAVMLQ